MNPPSNIQHPSLTVFLPDVDLDHGNLNYTVVLGEVLGNYEAEKKLVGQRTKRSYHLGDPITVSVKKTDPQKRIIDFNLLD